MERNVTALLETYVAVVWERFRKRQPHGFPLASFGVPCASAAMCINGKTARLGEGGLSERAERGRAPALSPRSETAAAQVLAWSGSAVSAVTKPTCYIPNQRAPLPGFRLNWVVPETSFSPNSGCPVCWVVTVGFDPYLTYTTSKAAVCITA